MKSAALCEWLMDARYVRLVLCRDVAALCREIEGYNSDSDVWKIHPAISNTAGNLALHLAGNLEHYIGAVLGRSGYVRDREAEFTLRDLPRAELLAKLKCALRTVDRTLSSMTDEQLDHPYPMEVAGLRLTTRLFLLHLCTHLAYHLGQIDYHRRLIGGCGASVGILRIADLEPEALNSRDKP